MEKYELNEELNKVLDQRRNDFLVWASISGLLIVITQKVINSILNKGE